VIGVAADSSDNIWIIHREGSLEAKEKYATWDPPASGCCVPAPPILEFNAKGEPTGREILLSELKQRIRADLVSVFVLPPSMAVLEQRLKTRAQDSDEVVRARMAKSADEMSHWLEYDYVFINHDIAESVRQVRSALDRLMQGRTTLVIAHRLSTVRDAARIVVLDGGLVAETGTHQELLTRGGIYSRLIAAQLTAITAGVVPERIPAGDA